MEAALETGQSWYAGATEGTEVRAQSPEILAFSIDTMFVRCYGTDMSVPNTRTQDPGKQDAGKVVKTRRLEDKSTTTRRRLSPEKRREEVIQVAAEVFARKGYRAANVTDIVQRAGIGRGTFYLYFDSKQDVFLELIERYFSGFEELLASNQKNLREAIATGDQPIVAWRSNIINILEFTVTTRTSPP